MTEESLPMEYSMTGFSNSAATSRKMWMLSASSNCRWLSFGATPASIVWTPKLATPAPSSHCRIAQ